MSKSEKKWFNFGKLDSDMPVLDIFDEIGGWGTWASDVVSVLDEITAPQIKVRLFSPGGYIDEGMQIYNALRRHPARIIIEIDSQAASIASVIAMAGDEIRMAENAFMMIHDPWSGVVGDASDMRHAADVLDQMKAAIVGAYVKRTGLDAQEIETMMSAETWMVAVDAVERGFADSVDDMAAEQNKASFSNKIINGFKNAPKALEALVDSVREPALMLSPVAMARINNQFAAADNKAGAMPEKKTKVGVVMNKDNKEQAAPVDTAAVQQNAVRNERERVNEIQGRSERAHDLVGKDKAEQLARAAIQAGKTPSEYSDSLMEAAQAKAAEQRHVMSSGIGLNAQEAGSFMMKNLFASLASNNRDLAGFEREVCDEMSARAAAAGVKVQGTAVPVDVIARPSNVVTTTGGAPLVQTDVLAQSFIELLRSKLLVYGMGATVLPGLEGSVSIPRQTAGASATWSVEGGQAAESVLSLDNLGLSPKSVTARYKVTKQMLLQGSLGIEALLRSDLALALAEGIDSAALFGSGVGAEPLGIANTTGVDIIAMGANGAALTSLDPLIDMVTAVKSAKAARGNLGFITNALVEGLIYKLKETTGGYLIRSKDTETPATGATLSVRGYDVATSEQILSNLTKGTGTGLSAAMFGNWSDLMIGEWGALDVLVNPYSSGISNLEIEVLQFCDIGVRHPGSFSMAKDVIA